ncbi:MAG: hypothetical protein BM556_06975 [Bacteriovorax sp. MedPE-SWde]|nr:MAG: hypothetical protein BM556_06975 [Bacteriovorax sp. MedPE-SWde]
MGKTLVMALVMVNCAFGQIINSDYESRLNTAITEAVTSECNQMIDLTLLSSKVEEDNIDQGITDYKYTSVLSGKQIYDQNIYDEYRIVVESEYYDGYDHATGEYGAYYVKNVKCDILF